MAGIVLLGSLMLFVSEGCILRIHCACAWCSYL